MSRQDPSIYLTAFVPEADKLDHPHGETGKAVEEGDCASSLSNKAGHFWETVWQRDENRELREARPDAHVLMPGDKLFIPPIEPKQLDCAIDARHRFRRRGVPEKLCIRLLIGDKARANEPYLLRVLTPEGEIDREGTTDGDGAFEEWIPPGATSATLFLLDDEFDLDLGRLDPANTTAGAISRLVNLGLLPNEGSADDTAFRSALGSFQRNRGIKVTYALDDATSAELDKCYFSWPGGTAHGG